MGKKAITSEIVNNIFELRKSGMSLDEIKKLTGVGKGTAFKYIKIIDKKFPNYKKNITGQGSVRRANREWNEAKISAEKVIGNLSARDKTLILASLYWGEGNKKEFNLINSDPILVKVVVSCLREMKITNSELKVSLRAYSDLDISKIKRFWSQLIDIPLREIGNVEILEGAKKGKLEHGMCRIRVKKSKKHFKFIMSVIDLIKSKALIV